MPIFLTPAPPSGRRGFRVLRGFAPGKALAFLLCAILACAGRGASASTYQINIQATNLTVNTTYGLSFALQNGTLGNPLQASISNFSLNGGTLGSSFTTPLPIGNPAVGSLVSTASTLSLATTDDIDLSDYVQEFSSTASSAAMSFALTLSSAAPQSDFSAPDFFQLSFLDANGVPVLTGGPPSGTSLVYSEFDSTSPSVQTFRTSNFNSPNTPDPKVAAQIQPSAAPEPGTLALLLPSGAGGVAWLHYRRRRTSAPA